MRGIVVDRTELEILDLVTYAIEALAEDLPREAAETLADLQDSLEHAHFVDPELELLLKGTLARVQRPPSKPADWPRTAAITLSGLSRQLWKRLLPQDPIQ